MIRGIKLSLVLVALGVLSSELSFASENDVSVNLSALDNLSSYAPAPAYPHHEPLFPIIKTAPAKSPLKAVKSHKPKVAKVKKNEVIATKSKVVATKSDFAPSKASQQPLQKVPFIKGEKPVEVVDVEPITKSEKTPKAVVLSQNDKVQPEIKAKNEPELQPTEKASLKSVTKPQPEDQPQPKTEAEQQPQPEAQPQPDTEAKSVANPKAPLLPEKAPQENANQENANQDENSQAAAPAPQLLIDTNQEQSSDKVFSQIKFEDDIDELSPEQEQQIDAIIASFEHADTNKIAIYAYNSDDTNDGFRRKRISLNRAINVRSYLLPKGYKNFSIKVINVSGASQKKNLVEISELKQ